MKSYIKLLLVLSLFFVFYTGKSAQAKVTVGQQEEIEESDSSEFEPNNTYDKANIYNAEGSFVGTISGDSDEDCFLVSLSRSGKIIISFAKDPAITVNYEVYSIDNRCIEPDYVEKNRYYTFGVDAGKYYVKISGTNNPVYNFKISLNDVNFEEQFAEQAKDKIDDKGNEAVETKGNDNVDEQVNDKANEKVDNKEETKGEDKTEEQVAEKTTKSSKNTLSKVVVKNGTLSKEFDPNTTSYVITTESNKVIIRWSRSSKYATTYVSNENVMKKTAYIKPGQTKKFRVVVVAQNGDKKTYTFTLKRSK